MIRIHSSASELLNDPETIHRVLEIAAAMENLRIVILLNGRKYEGEIKYSDTNAVVEITINT